MWKYHTIPSSKPKEFTIINIINSCRITGKYCSIPSSKHKYLINVEILYHTIVENERVNIDIMYVPGSGFRHGILYFEVIFYHGIVSAAVVTPVQ